MKKTSHFLAGNKIMNPMKRSMYLFAIISLLFGSDAHSQITRELQDAINNVPFARFDYPANRDHNIPPGVASPQAFVFAYYKLPYAINLKPVYNNAINGYVEKVLIDFKSVKMNAVKERRMLLNTLIQLQGLIDRQGKVARIAGFNDYLNFNPSYISQFVTSGDVIIAIRELMSSQDLYNSLVARADDLTN